MCGIWRAAISSLQSSDEQRSMFRTVYSHRGENRQIRFFCFESKNVEVLFPARIRKKSKRERRAAFLRFTPACCGKSTLSGRSGRKYKRRITGAKLPLRFKNAAFFYKIPLFPPLYFHEQPHLLRHSALKSCIRPFLLLRRAHRICAAFEDVQKFRFGDGRTV
mgnify:CR=1 FL=1